MAPATSSVKLIDRPLNTSTTWVILASSLVLLSACGLRNSQPEAPVDIEQGKIKAPGWFCQAGESHRAWECVEEESPEVGSNKSQKRTRLANEPDRPVTTDPAPRMRLAQPAFSTTAQATDSQPRPLASQQSAEVSPPTAAQARLPSYQALAYRPEVPTAITDLPPDFYAVQLLALSDKARLEKFARENDLVGLSAARIRQNEQMIYVLLLGIYETYDHASRAIESLPQSISDLSPWIRPMGSLQQAMLLADQAAGSEYY